MIDNAAGKQGTVVWTESRSGHTARVWRKVRNPSTNAQDFVRTNLSRASKTFESMTPAQAAAWNAYGQTITRTNPLNGKTYHPAGIDVFVGLTTKFLQLNPNGTIPLTPPSSDFTGDSITLVAESESPGLIHFTASGANAAGVTTEILVQKLSSGNSVPSPDQFKHAAFKAFTSGSLTLDVNVPAGRYAVAYRFVRTATGQATNPVGLPVMVIGLSVEAGGTASTSRKKAA